MSGRSPGVGKVTTPGFLPGKLHGQRSLAGYSPQGYKEWDTAEHTHTQCNVSLATSVALFTAML